MSNREKREQHENKDGGRFVLLKPVPNTYILFPGITGAVVWEVSMDRFDRKGGN